MKIYLSIHDFYFFFLKKQCNPSQICQLAPPSGDWTSLLTEIEKLQVCEQGVGDCFGKVNHTKVIFFTSDVQLYIL